MDGDTAITDRIIGCAIDVEQLAPIHTAQMLTYLRVTSLRIGLILNFNSATIKEGTRRVVLTPHHPVTGARA